jgi:hypothetical protein
VLLVGGLVLCLFGVTALPGLSGARTGLWSAGIVLAVAIAAVAGRAWVEVHPVRVAGAVGVLGLVWSLSALPEDNLSRERVFRRCVLLLILLFAFGLRWSELRASIERPLDPDALTYLVIARILRNPFATGLREPLTIWCIRAFLMTFGDTVTSLRVTSIFFSLFAIGASYVLTNRFFGWRVGCAAAALLAWWPDGRTLSVRGLRDELIAAVAWLFVGIVYEAKPSGCSRSGKPLIALATAPVLLSSLASLLPTFLVLGLAVLTKRLRLQAAIGAAAFGLCLVAPYAWWNWKHFGDPLFSVNISARGFANYESAGKPGFPSREEVRRDLSAGKHMTTAEYVFGQHSASEIVKRVLRGYTRLLNGYFRGPVTIDGRRISLLLAMFVLGAVVAFSTVPGRYLICAMLLWLGPIAFLGGATEFKLDWRLASPVWALHAGLMGLALIVVSRGRVDLPFVRGSSRKTGRDVEGTQRDTASSGWRR